jgi:hypothetical protein
MSAVKAEDYAFTAAVANARAADGKSFEEKYVELDIREYDDQANKAISGIWTRMQTAIQKYHEYAEDAGAAPGWSLWSVQKWCESKDPPNRQKFIAWDGDVIAGFLTVRPDFPSQHDAGKQALYLEHLGAAPGNQRTPIWCRRLKNVGQSLVAFAVLQSLLRGYEGLVGLHAADAQAEGFYAKLDGLSGVKLFREDSKLGVAAPQPLADRRAVDRPYHETTPEGAAALLARYLRPK